MFECARTTRFCFVPVEPKPALLSAQNNEPFSSHEAKALAAPIVPVTPARTAVATKVVIVRRRMSLAPSGSPRRGCGRVFPDVAPPLELSQRDGRTVFVRHGRCWSTNVALDVVPVALEGAERSCHRPGHEGGHFCARRCRALVRGRRRDRPGREFRP